MYKIFDLEINSRYLECLQNWIALKYLFQGRRLRFYTNITLIFFKKILEVRGLFYQYDCLFWLHFWLEVCRQRFKSPCCLMLQVFAMPVPVLWLAAADGEDSEPFLLGLYPATCFQLLDLDSFGTVTPLGELNCQETSFPFFLQD